MGIKILIADDDENIRLSLQHVFSEHLVFEAGNGEAALRSILENRPDVVLLDIDMPGMSGIEVLEAIRDSVNKPQIFVLTGNEKLEMADKMLGLGAKSYITKPFEVDRIRQIVLDTAVDSEVSRNNSAKSWTVIKPDS